MNKIKGICSILLFTILLASCTVEHRTYLSGYHIDWKTKNSSPLVIENFLSSEDTRNKQGISPLFNSEKPQPIIEEPITTASNEITPFILPVKKNEINTSKIKVTTPFRNEKNDQVKEKKFDEGDNKKSEGKSQMVALLLVIFVGVLGIHRFYLGYTTIGIIQLLTFGGCGVWSLIDLIMIITGELKPIDGEYTDKL